MNISVLQSFESYESLLHQSVRDFYTASRMGDVALQTSFFNNAIMVYNKILQYSSENKAQVIWANAFAQLELT